MHYKGHIDFSIVARTSDRVVGEMPIGAGILNPFGTVHAGAMIWFADVTATTLALEGRDASAGMTGFPLAINLVANLASNQKAGLLRATATYVKRGKTMSIVRTAVEGEEGKLLVEVTTTHLAAR